MEIKKELERILKEISRLDFSNEVKVEKYRNFVRNILKKDNAAITNEERAIFTLFLSKEMIHDDNKSYEPVISFGSSLGMLAKAIKTVMHSKSNGVERVNVDRNSRIFIYYEALGKGTIMGGGQLPQIIDLMHAVPHEYRHMIQQEQTIDGDMNIKSLKVTVDELYRRSLTEKEYYQNWKNLEFERDAEIFGWTEAKNILAKYAPEMLATYEEAIDAIITNIENSKSNTIKRIATDGTIYEVDKSEDRNKFIKSIILEKKEEIKLYYIYILGTKETTRFKFRTSR